MKKAFRVLVIHGPNLHLLGTREPEVYGRVTLSEINQELDALGKKLGASLETFQSNHEGEILDKISHSRGSVDGILINPAGLTHTSVALRDALLASGVPFVEVHLSNIYKREEFRHHSYLSDAAVGQVVGFGKQSYWLGLQGLIQHLDAL
jgi:3-dehydroquinate dehydratase-2